MVPVLFRRHRPPLVALAGVLVLGTLGYGAADVPARLSDQDFWKLSVEASEPGGYFRSQDIINLTSNEMGYEYVIDDLVRRVKPGGVYLGVGPEQNYTYMSALRPGLAIIFDIRRGNLDLQLMYKAIFELSGDRADFVSMLFSRARPSGLGAASTVADLFRVVGGMPPGDAQYTRNLTAIETRLTTVHGWAVPARDLDGVRQIYETFFRSGYAIRASPTYVDLMTATDERGVPRSFLASEQAFAFLKDLQSRNLVVPVVGDFGGPKAIRAVGAYLKTLNGTVGAFYLSNVEQYLAQNGKWDAFCRNVATLPLDGSSTFIRSSSGGRGLGRGPGFVSSLGTIADETAGCRAAR